MEIILKTLQGLEEVLVEEVKQLGGKEVEQLRRAVRCQGDLRLIYKLNLHSRLALSVLTPIAKWRAMNYTDIYDGARQIHWSDHMRPTDTFALRANSHSEYFKNTMYALQRVKDGIVDRARSAHGNRPSVDKDDPDLWLNLHIYEDQAQILWNTSGAPLFYRGYEKQRGIAPINEVLAAGIIALSGWTPDQNVYDPMCGSGTFVLETGAVASAMASQRHRAHFHFMNHPSYDSKLWADVRAEQVGSPMTGSKIYASDIDPEAISNVRSNLNHSKLLTDHHVWKSDFFKIYLGAKPGWVFMNPPYNERLSLEQSVGWHMSVGKILRERYGGWKVCIMSGDRDALKHLGLRPDRKIQLVNGSIPIDVFFISMYDR